MMKDTLVKEVLEFVVANPGRKHYIFTARKSTSDLLNKVLNGYVGRGKFDIKPEAVAYTGWHDDNELEAYFANELHLRKVPVPDYLMKHTKHLDNVSAEAQGLVADLEKAAAGLSRTPRSVSAKALLDTRRKNLLKYVAKLENK